MSMKITIGIEKKLILKNKIIFQKNFHIYIIFLI